MRIANALRDTDAVLAHFSRCSEVLQNLDLEPAPSTHRLLEHLRR